MNSLDRIASFAVVAAIAGCGGQDARGTASSASSSAVTAAPPVSASAPASAPTATCSVRTKPLRFALWSPTGARLLTGGPTEVAGSDEGKPVLDGSIDSWNLGGGELAFTLHLGTALDPGRTEPFAFVGFAPGEKSAVASGTSHLGPSLPVARWNLETGATDFAPATIHYPEGIDVSHDGKLAIVDGGGSNAVVLELPTLKVVQSVLNDTAASGSMIFSKDDEAIVNDWQMGLSLDDPRSLKAKKQWPQAFGATSPDRARVALYAKGFWGVVDATTGAPIKTFARPSEEASGGSIVFKPDGKRVALELSGTVSVWDVEMGRKSAEAKTAGPCRYTRDGAVLLCKDAAFESEMMRALPPLPPGRVELAYGHVVLIVDQSKASLFDLQAMRELRTYELAGVTDETPLAMSPAGRFLAYARKDTGTVRVVGLSDQETVDLGIAWIDGKQRGFVVSSQGAFEGPEPAACLATTMLGRTPSRADGILKRFLPAL